MSTWTVVLVASVLAYALKLAGHLVPAHLLEHPAAVRVTAALPVALLAGLVATQTFGGEGGTLVVDARLVAVLVAVVALALRAPFIVVVALAALVAAGLRAAGWG